jgi:hypothetical protein
LRGSNDEDDFVRGLLPPLAIFVAVVIVVVAVTCRSVERSRTSPAARFVLDHSYPYGLVAASTSSAAMHDADDPGISIQPVAAPASNLISSTCS